MRRRILVTGGLGFQGAHLVRALVAKGDDVAVLATPTPRALKAAVDLHEQGALPRVIWGSVADAEILEKSVMGQDVIVHMAAWASVDVSLDRPWPPFEINAQGTLSVLEACRRFAADARVVVASSCEVYGPTTRTDDGEEIRCQGEDWPLNPRSPYAASKIAADRYAYAYGVTYGMDVVILRPCNIFGPGQRAGAMGAVIPTFTLAALTDQPLKITGGGEQFREFLYVEDLVAAYVAVIDGPRAPLGSTYNIGSGETRTVRDLATQVVIAIPGTAPVEYSAARVADVSGFRLDSTRFQGAYGWKPKVVFGQGLALYLEWARAQYVARGTV